MADERKLFRRPLFGCRLRWQRVPEDERVAPGEQLPGATERDKYIVFTIDIENAGSPIQAI